MKWKGKNQLKTGHGLSHTLSCVWNRTRVRNGTPLCACVCMCIFVWVEIPWQPATINKTKLWNVEWCAPCVRVDVTIIMQLVHLCYIRANAFQSDCVHRIDVDFPHKSNCMDLNKMLWIHLYLPFKMWRYTRIFLFLILKKWDSMFKQPLRKHTHHSNDSFVEQSLSTV